MMKGPKYRYAEGKLLPAEPGDVIVFNHGGDPVRDPTRIVFRCPCGRREVVVSLEKHKVIAFDEAGALTVEDSISNEGRGGIGLCHFFVRGGGASMVEDSTCPGALR